MLIRTTALCRPLFRPLTSRNARALRNDTLFSRKDTAASRPRPRGNCVQSELCPSSVSLFSSSAYPILLPLSAVHPRNLYRGYVADDARGGICTARDKKKKNSGKPRSRNTIVSPRSSGLHLRHLASSRAKKWCDEEIALGWAQRKRAERARCNVPATAHWFLYSPL